VIERNAVLQLQLAINDLKAGIGHGVGVGVTIVDVGGPEVTHDGAGGVLRHRAVVERDV